MQAIIVLNSTAEEIAALVLGVQGQPAEKATSSVDLLQTEELVRFNCG